MRNAQNLPMAERRKQWEETFGWLPPTSTKRQFLEGNLHYHLQTQTHGGLSRPAVRRLTELASKFTENPTHTPVATGANYKPGTRLIRQYKGKPHEVTITADGFGYDGKTYTSLSAIARHITGTPWNGRIFFGLKGAVIHGR
jgi:hypothetical protein